jgi:hypothetical protein
MLRPTERLIAQYGSPGHPSLLLTLLYWSPVKLTVEDRAMFAPHNPEGCYPAGGWTQLEEHAADDMLPELPGETVKVRVFTRGDQTQLVMYWQEMNELIYLYPVEFWQRFKALLASWHEPPTAEFEARYSVTIGITVTGTVEEARDTAVRFARELGPVLPSFGFVRR